MTLAELPISYMGKCTIVVNDMDIDIVARNVIILLTALYFDPEEAVPIIMHIWYSALIPSAVLLSLQEKILPLIEDVCKKVEQKAQDSLQAKTWTYGAKACRVILQK